MVDWPPSDDIGRKRETPMNSTPDPKEIKPHDATIARADEGLAHAHAEIKRADEQLTRLTEQLAKMERDDARPPSAGLGSQGSGAQGPGPQPAPGRPALLTLVGLSLAACITVAALLVLLLSYGDGPTLIVARWAPQPVSTPSLPPENLPSPAEPAPSTFQVAAAESAPAQATPPQATPAQTTPAKQQPWLRPHRKTPRRQHPQRFPIRHSCCKRWRAASRIWSETSNSSRRTSSKWPATIQKP